MVKIFWGHNIELSKEPCEKCLSTSNLPLETAVNYTVYIFVSFFVQFCKNIGRATFFQLFYFAIEDKSGGIFCHI